jgi:FLVCR family MFS transporter
MMSQQLLPPPENKPVASVWRWYCLAVASSVAAIQGGYWTNFGPIAPAVKPLFGWADSDIALLANWGPITFLLTALPTAWLLDIGGLRPSCVCAAALTFGGAVLRCVHVHPDALGSVLMHLGQILNAAAGPVAMAVGPVVSAQWFPSAERTFATAVVATANYGGSAAMFVLGPLLVPAGGSMSATRTDVLTYMLGEAAVAAV